MNFNLIKKIISNNKDFLLAALITILGTLLRIYDYSVVPQKTFTFDEYAFAWSGMSLIYHSVPTSWSYLSAYDTDTLINIEWLGKKNLYLATPWFDHPPLFGLIVGGFAILLGANTFWECTTELIRVPSLIFTSISIFIFYFITNKLFNTRIATITTLIFATDPLFVYLSRLAVSENLLILILLGSLFCFLEYLNTSRPIYFYILILLTSLAPLVKVTGLFIVLAFTLMFIYTKKVKNGLIVLSSGCFAFSLYFVYGWFYNFKLFISVLKANSKRFNSILIIKEMIFSGNLPFTDAWFILGWMTLFYGMKNIATKYKIQLISLPLITYVFILIFAGAQSHFYCWYTIPLYPFLLIYTGFFISEFLKKPSLLNSSIILVFLFSWCLNYGLGTPWSDFYLLNFKGFKYIFIFLMSMIYAPILIQEIFKFKNLLLINRIIATLVFTSCIIANILITYNLKNILQSNLIK
ncbi:glycosyltransferase family 39 protein [Nostoc sp. UHCC 0702]|nr:glycosyltransferase family 39 protein [Nostoc sp. UHCC 0702]